MSSIQIIGIDGGATKVSAWEVEHSDNTFSLGQAHYADQYVNDNFFNSGFSPVNIQKQLAEMNDNTVQLTSSEKDQGEAMVQTFANVIQHIHSGKPVLLGIGMPGLKTNDKRGIVAMANGPRIPHFCDQLEEQISQMNISLAAPIFQLGSDADYCGIGEEYASSGAFKECQFGYYLGGGTGAADALKCKGEILPLDQTKSWLAKSWEMKTKEGLSLERFASAGGIQFIYSLKSGISVEKLNREAIYPNQILERAIAGENTAIETLKDVSHTLAKLLYERIETLFAGWQSPFSFVNPSRAPLESSHPYLGNVFDKFIIGQRLGTLMEESKQSIYLWHPFLSYLEMLISSNNKLDFHTKNHYLKNGIEKMVYISQLRDAPALGAGVDAFHQFNVS